MRTDDKKIKKQFRKLDPFLVHMIFCDYQNTWQTKAKYLRQLSKISQLMRKAGRNNGLTKYLNIYRYMNCA